jgi:transcription elongation GreA/GreB family factor
MEKTTVTGQSMDELLLAAAEDDSAETLEALTKKIAGTPDLSAGDTAKNVEFLLESWGDSVSKSEARAEMCMRLAEKFLADSQAVRNAISDAAKKLLPPYLSKPSYIRSIGIRDKAVKISEIPSRMRALLKLKIGNFVWQPDTRSWKQISNIDEFTSSVSLGNMNGTVSQLTPVAVVISGYRMFESESDVWKIASPDRPSLVPASEYRKIMDRLSVAPLSSAVKKEIAASTVIPGILTHEKFEIWWNCQDSVKSGGSAPLPGGVRRASQARSLHELHLLLEEAQSDRSKALNESDIENFTKFFGNLKKITNAKDMLMLAESLAAIAAVYKDADLAVMLAGLNGKADFLPGSMDGYGALPKLEAWAKVPAKLLPEFVKTVKIMLSEDYLVMLAQYLPLRCVGAFYDCVDSKDKFHDAILNAKSFTSDMILWVWKNRSKLPPEMFSLITMDNIIQALSILDMPKEWLAAQRELKKLLIEKEDIQKAVVKNAGDDINSIVYAVRKAKNLHVGEQQTILVKLTRHAKEIKEILEKGDGRFSQTAHLHSEAKPAAVHQQVFTSVSSFRARVKELENLVNVLIPQNREALKTARSYGDLRENAEYDIAKSNRNLLSRRRDELERDIASIMQLDFRAVKVEGYVVTGCEVVLASASGEKKSHYLVGAWDGNTEKHMIPYNSRFGDAVMHRKTGDKVTLPDGSECVISEVKPLPADMAAKLSE